MDHVRRSTARGLLLSLTLAAGCGGEPPRDERLTRSPGVALALAPPREAVALARHTPGATCLDLGTPTHTFTGKQSSRYDERRDIPASAILLTAGATWESSTRGSPVRVGEGDGICWHGGRLIGLFSDAMSWADFHDTYAFVGYGPSMVVENLRAHNFGDGVKWLGSKTDDWTVRRVHLSHMHDDCVETDWAKSGRIEDVLFEGCYVFLATRPRSSSIDSVDGIGDTIVVDRAVVWMEPMLTVYSGPSPSTGAVFKVDDATPSRSPRLRLRNLVLRVDVEPGVGNACLDPQGLVAESVDNVVVWLGAGDYPCLPLPAGWTLTRDREVYDDAVARWKARHSDF